MQLMTEYVKSYKYKVSMGQRCPILTFASHLDLREADKNRDSIHTEYRTFLQVEMITRYRRCLRRTLYCARSYDESREILINPKHEPKATCEPLFFLKSVR